MVRHITFCPFYEQGPLPRICKLFSINHQWQEALQAEIPRENTHFVLLNPQTKALGKADTYAIGFMNAKCMGAIFKLFEEIYSFFCVDSGLPSDRGQAFGIWYHSESSKVASDCALFFLRILHYIHLTGQVGWPLYWDYRFRLSKELAGIIDEIIKENEESAEYLHTVTQKKGRRVLVMVNRAKHPHEEKYVCPSGDLPKNAKVFSGPASKQVADQPLRMNLKRKLKVDMKRSSAKSGKVAKLKHWNPEWGKKIAALKPSDTVGAKRVKDENAISGTVKGDRGICEFLTPVELHNFAKVSRYTAALTYEYFSFPMSWACDVTDIMKRFYAEEWGKAHLVVDSWGQQQE